MFSYGDTKGNIYIVEVHTPNDLTNHILAVTDITANWSVSGAEISNYCEECM
jgi:hypothetical protein